MRKTTILFGAIIAGLVLVAVLVPHRDPDAEIAQRLQRPEQTDASGSTTSQLSAQNWRLSDQVEAVKATGRETWFAVCDDNGVKIQFPFPPEATGVFPKTAESDRVAEAESGIDENPGFVGADACRECHQERHKSFSLTGHYNTSAAAGTDAIAAGQIQGSFDPPGNRFDTPSPGLSFGVENVRGRLWQQVRLADWSTRVPLDIVTGSAKTGQTYLYWLRDELYQAHVSLMADTQEWVHSPGYSPTSIDYSRPIKTVCVECHLTYIQQRRPPNHYHRETAILGISCERCHGPGRQHIEYHHANPEQKKARHIVQPAQLTRRQQLDICGQCHSGIFKVPEQPFGFRPGMALADFHELEDADSDLQGGIHTSNQLARLEMSECFKQSEMTCTSCHNPHVSQRGDTAAFTASCLKCHQVEHCGKFATLGDRIAEDCISCHMPIMQNKDIQLHGSRGAFVMPMVDHFIRAN